MSSQLPARGLDDDYEIDYELIAAEAYQRQEEAMKKHLLDEVRVYTFAGGVMVILCSASAAALAVVVGCSFCSS